MNRIAAAFSLAGLLALPAQAAWRDMTAADFRVPPPPAPGSADFVADFSTLLRLQSSRTPEQCALAKKMRIPDFRSLYGSSGLLTPEETAAVQPFVDEVSRKASKVTGVFKNEYSRPRPYDEDARVQPCADKPGGAKSYPSGHAVSGAVDACVLAKVFPDRAAKLAEYGAFVGELRVISGVHHPSDVAASRDLAAQICARLDSESDFNAEVAALRSRLGAK